MSGKGRFTAPGVDTDVGPGTAIFVAALLVFFRVLFSHNVQVAGFAARHAAIEAGSDASPAKIAVKEWDVPTQLPPP